MHAPDNEVTIKKRQGVALNGPSYAQQVLNLRCYKYTCQPDTPTHPSVNPKGETSHSLHHFTQVCTPSVSAAD